MTKADKMLEYLKLAERIIPISIQNSQSVGQFPNFIKYRTLDEVLAAAEKIKQWCEPKPRIKVINQTGVKLKGRK